MTQNPDPARIAQRTLTANGIRQHYLIAGSGAPLLLLHGWPQHAGAWRRLIPALAATRMVIAPDLRGAGFSDKPAAGYDKATLAKDVHALMQALGHARYAVVGHDIGGMVGYALAAQFRDAVSHLAIVDVPLPGIDPWDRMQGAPPLWHFAFHAQRDLAEALIGGRERPTSPPSSRAAPSIPARSAKRRSTITRAPWRRPAACAAAWSFTARLPRTWCSTSRPCSRNWRSRCSASAATASAR